MDGVGLARMGSVTLGRLRADYPLLFGSVFLVQRCVVDFY